WRSCVNREVGALSPPGRQAPIPRTVAPPAPYRPPPSRNAPPVTTPAAVSLPDWQGPRPPMPSSSAMQDLSPQEIFRTVEPSVYIIRAARTAEEIDQDEGTLGSAVAISTDMALTNCHVIENQSVIRVGATKQVSMPATVARADRRGDRCLLKVDGKLHPVS